MKLIEIDQIHIDGGTQSREQLSQEAIADYRQHYEEETPLPPLTVFFDGSRHWLADGFHRLMAAQQAGMFSVVCDVKTGSKADAVLFAASANQSHGVRRTNADKRKAVKMVLDVAPDWSDRKIANHVGVGAPLVADVRSQVKEITPDATARGQVKEITPDNKRTGKDGKEYPVKKRQEEPASTLVIDEEEPEQEEPPFVVEPAPAKPKVTFPDIISDLDRLTRRTDDLLQHTKNPYRHSEAMDLLGRLYDCYTAWKGSRA